MADDTQERGEEESAGKGHQSRYLRKNGGLQNITDTADLIYLTSVALTFAKHFPKKATRKFNGCSSGYFPKKDLF
ncbi:hypothetical protein PbDSM24746_61890 [Paenibacillus macerans]|nr:hypothetical protein PbDSM24746_61890 [Paenibacillus macerans]GBK72490.1 hypothetical protein PbJCM17693_61980 [Paenibacillus macerans]GIP13172.1 hypothetical protein J1TS5_53420 [Paenibacillus macerans]